MSDMRQNIWLEARQAFLPLKGVVGVGYGPKVTGGKAVTRRAIIVLVEKKLPPRELPKVQIIPAGFRGLPRWISTQSGSAWHYAQDWHPRRSQHSPLPPCLPKPSGRQRSGGHRDGSRVEASGPFQTALCRAAVKATAP